MTQCIDLFCCIGSYAFGADMTVIVAVDVNAKALDIYRCLTDIHHTKLVQAELGTADGDRKLNNAVEEKVDPNLKLHVHAAPPSHMIPWTLDYLKYDIICDSWSIVVRESDRDDLQEYITETHVYNNESYIIAKSHGTSSNAGGSPIIHTIPPFPTMPPSLIRSILPRVYKDHQSSIESKLQALGFPAGCSALITCKIPEWEVVEILQTSIPLL